MKYIILFCMFTLVAKPLLAQNQSSVVLQHYKLPNEPGGIAFCSLNSVETFTPFGLANMETAEPVKSITNFRMASVSKQITAMSVQLLIRNHLLSFHSPIKDFLPELPHSTRDITINHLLQHSSGIWDYEALIPEKQQVQLSDKDVLQLVSDKDSVYFKAGTKFRYSNTGYCLLALIIERISKENYSDFVAQHIFKPLSMSNSLVYDSSSNITNRAFGYHPVANTFKFADQSITSATKGDGGVYTSAQEYLKWLSAQNPLFDSLYWKALKERKIYIRDNVYYSLGWFITLDHNGNISSMFHSGESTGFHNIVLYQPLLKNTYGIFTNRDDNKIAGLFEEILEKHTAKPKVIHLPLFDWLSKIYASEL